MIVIHCLGSLKCAGWNLVPRAAWIMKVCFGVILFSCVHWMFRGACLPPLSGLGFRAHSSLAAWAVPGCVLLKRSPLHALAQRWLRNKPMSDVHYCVCDGRAVGNLGFAPTEDNEWPIDLGTAREPQEQHCEATVVPTTQLPLLSPCLCRLLCVSFLLLNPGQKGVVWNYFRLSYGNNSMLPRRAAWTGDPVTK